MIIMIITTNSTAIMLGLHFYFTCATAGPNAPALSTVRRGVITASHQYRDLCRSSPCQAVLISSQNVHCDWLCDLLHLSLLPTWIQVLLTVPLTTDRHQSSCHRLPSLRIVFFTHIPFSTPGLRAITLPHRCMFSNWKEEGET